ncbi:coiled-coil domain-containing protein 148-like [Bolinopsis microptera]|uniref:coiled-coil domain-containing protein 148-like n=1 Tax=Bolinopsis microptera TaxID=2820187 RepID=UPI0030797A11
MGKGNIDDLATKFCVGSNAQANQTYRHVDYKELRLKLQQEKLKLHLDRQHLKKFNSVKTRYGTTSAFNQHKEVWLKEDISIKSQIRSISAVISEQADPSQLLCENEICEFLNSMQEEFKAFEVGTIQPVWEFIEDMQQWLLKPDTSNAIDIKPIYETMTSQQNHILDVLNDQGQSLDNDLSVFNSVLKAWEFEAESVTESLLRLKFPHEETICEYIEEYLSVDKKYNDVLMELRDYYSIMLDKGKHGGWCNEDHILFRHITHQYPVDKFQRSTLCLEMLKLVMCHKTELELKEHGEWVQLYDMYWEHRKSIKHMHQSALQKLVATAEADCKQQWVQVREMRQKADEILSQKENTARIFENLLRCRADKLKKIRAEEKELSGYQERMNKERAEFERRRAKQRKADKDKIQVFNEMKEDKQKEFERRLEQLKDKQAAMKKNKLAAGKKRVDHRHELHDKKLEEQAAAEAQQHEEEQRRKEQLDKLAATVAVEAPYDPARVHRDTKATTARLKESDYIGKFQLFKVVGYEDSAISGDMRWKVEKALRNAGLMTTDYGRQIMKNIAPPVEPRKDMISTVFKKDNET